MQLSLCGIAHHAAPRVQSSRFPRDRKLGETPISALEGLGRCSWRPSRCGVVGRATAVRHTRTAPNGDENDTTGDAGGGTHLMSAMRDTSPCSEGIDYIQDILHRTPYAVLAGCPHPRRARRPRSKRSSAMFRWTRPRSTARGQRQRRPRMRLPSPVARRIGIGNPVLAHRAPRTNADEHAIVRRLRLDASAEHCVARI